MIARVLACVLVLGGVLVACWGESTPASTAPPPKKWVRTSKRHHSSHPHPHGPHPHPASDHHHHLHPHPHLAGADGHHHPY